MKLEIPIFAITLVDSSSAELIAIEKFFDKSKTEVFIKGHSVYWYKYVVKSDLTT